MIWQSLVAFGGSQRGERTLFDFIHQGGHNQVQRLSIWRSNTSQISLRLDPEVSISPIYILGDFWRIWRSREGRPKLEGLVASRAGHNLSSWGGLTVHWLGSSIFSHIFLVGGLSMLGSLLLHPLGVIYLSIVLIIVSIGSPFCYYWGFVPDLQISCIQVLLTI